MGRSVFSEFWGGASPRKNRPKYPLIPLIPLNTPPGQLKVNLNPKFTLCRVGLAKAMHVHVYVATYCNSEINVYRGMEGG